MPYYYLGYLLVGLPAKIAQTPGPLAYSMAMVLVFAARILRRADRSHTGWWPRHGLATATTSGRSRASGSTSRRSPSGLLAGTLTMVVGNLVGVFELIGARGWGSPEFWAAVGVKGLGPVEPDLAAG